MGRGNEAMEAPGDEGNGSKIVRGQMGERVRQHLWRFVSAPFKVKLGVAVARGRLPDRRLFREV